MFRRKQIGSNAFATRRRNFSRKGCGRTGLRVQLNSPSSRPELSAGAALSTYLIFGAISIFVTFPPLMMTTEKWADHRSDLPSDLAALLFCVGLPAAVFFWIRRFRIVVSNSQLSYRSLFSGTRSIALSDVKSAKTEIGMHRLLGHSIAWWSPLFPGPVSSLI